MKFSLHDSYPRHWMEVRGQLHASITSASWKEAPATHWIRGWVGPGADLDAMAKRKSHGSAVELVSRRCTD
jgi:hypothetical protein